MNFEPDALMLDWLLRIRTAQLAHIKSSIYFDRLNLWLGIPLVVLTTLVGTSVFATLQKEASTSIRIATGVASVLAAILAGVQTFLRYSERAQKHAVSGGKYGVLRREIEQKLVFPPSNSEEIEKYIDSLRLRWDKLSEACPTTPQKVWESVEIDIETIKEGLTKSTSQAKGAA